MKKLQKLMVIAGLGLGLLLGTTPGWAGGPPNPTMSDGNSNTAGGTSTLISNTSGLQNTAFGFEALTSNIAGVDNTAVGSIALSSNTTGGNNTGIGTRALYRNTTGQFNTATGVNSLFGNTTGFFDTAVGAEALRYNTTGNYNTAVGFQALTNNQTGLGDTAVGTGALIGNSTGQHNTAVGVYAMAANMAGINNIALGFGAGSGITIGSNDIDIGHPGMGRESNTIRIGTPGTQTATYIAGISGASVTGDAIVVSNTGQLGIVMSSVRYKRDIHDMDAASSNLMKLRPVTFRYKNDPAGTLQYGLVAEEVAKLYPDLVSYADGKVVTVHYHELVPMLVNELQKQTAANQRQAEQIRKLAVQVAQDKISTERKIVELQANHDRELRVMQAGFGQRLSALERATAEAPVPVKF